MISPTATVTCDQCRKRKVRCVPGPPRLSTDGEADTAAREADEDVESNTSQTGTAVSPLGNTSAARPKHGQCKNCARRGEECTYVYMPKKPGRPRAPRSQQRSRRDRDSESPRGSDSTPSASSSSSDTPWATDMALGLTTCPSTPLGPAAGSIFGSARQTLQNSIAFDYTLPPPLSPESKSSARPDHDLPLESSALNETERVGSGPGLALGLDVFSPSTTLADLMSVSEGAGDSGLAWGESAGASASGSTSTAGSSYSTRGIPPKDSRHTPMTAPTATAAINTSRIQNFASWEDVGFFLSLHMKHQHMLVPLVHWPSFAQDVLHRRDEVDEAFRGLLLSMVAYTICQCPINWLVGRMDKPALEALLARCQRGSRMIQIRHQTRPSLVVLASTILDWITSQSAGPAALSATLMADVRRLVYSLGLNRAEPREGLNVLELQLCRRLFWEAYAIDKTNALNGHPINLHDMDGVPPLPLEVDDEFLSPDGGAQPAGKLSYMTGFAFLARLFRVLSACIVRHRTLLAASVEDDQFDSAPDGTRLLRWVTASMEDVHGLLAQLPDELRAEHVPHDAPPSVFGTQAANLRVTALCVELALLDLRSKLVPEEDTERARTEIAQRAFRQLEHMPLECLASNGESMRGKVVRVILALLGAASSNDGGTLSDGLWDWWNMYSRVQFIQLLPELRD